MKKILSAIAMTSTIFSFANAVTPIIQNSPVLKKAPIITITSVGEGVEPVNVQTPAQARVLARRAAVADAYRELSAKLYGIKVTAKETVKDLMITNSKIQTEVYGSSLNLFHSRSLNFNLECYFMLLFGQS